MKVTRVFGFLAVALLVTSVALAQDEQAPPQPADAAPEAGDQLPPPPPGPGPEFDGELPPPPPPGPGPEFDGELPPPPPGFEGCPCKGKKCDKKRPMGPPPGEFKKDGRRPMGPPPGDCECKDCPCPDREMGEARPPRRPHHGHHRHHGPRGPRGPAPGPDAEVAPEAATEAEATAPPTEE
ncbi:MAG: hypothetical protein Q4D38_04495 [Planctomycetia bacterium]|nr:hypothetical protein [Planctomycetia bacterium]